MDGIIDQDFLQWLEKWNPNLLDKIIKEAFEYQRIKNKRPVKKECLWEHVVSQNTFCSNEKCLKHFCEYPNRNDCAYSKFKE
jgi:hypothetical protein